MKDSTPISVGVVIPVYKRTITNHESIALQQCMQVLGHYPVWLAAPHRLDLSYYLNLYPNLQVRTFDDQFFTGIAAYNKLMLSNVFYEAFQDIEYMLIHQLDAGRLVPKRLRLHWRTLAPRPRLYELAR